MLTYASVAQLAEHVSAEQLDKLDDGDDLRYIEEASCLVRAATKNDRYETTPAGLPADPVAADAMTVATCVQVREWITNAVNPLAGSAGLAPVAASASTNGSSISYQVTEQAAARARLLECLSDSAVRVLRAEGLASTAVARR
ncbi:hypothetical protein [Nocardia testacea]|uniref:hypothetical protein n=1 Tax=Nocardia testacea TaxID=248551 RepID=UPI0003010623|nr:hypothetical protein [Nocardia testacea]